MDIPASSEHNQYFYSTDDFFVRFTTLSERNVPLQEEKSNALSHRIGVKLVHFKIRLLFMPPLPPAASCI